MDQRQHNPHLVRQIRHPSMPQPQIPNHNTPLPHTRLTGSANLPALGEQGFLDTAAGSVAVGAFLDLQAGQRACVGAEPELRAAVLGREVYQGDVDYQGERVGWVGEVGVGVHWLALGGWVGHGGVAGAEGPFRAGAEVSCC